MPTTSSSTTGLWRTPSTRSSLSCAAAGSTGWPAPGGTSDERQNGPPMISPGRCDYRAKWLEFTRGLGSAPILADDDHAPFAPLLVGRAPVVLENGSAAAGLLVTVQTSESRARVRSVPPPHVVRRPRPQELDRGALDPQRERAQAARRPRRPA